MGPRNGRRSGRRPHDGASARRARVGDAAVRRGAVRGGRSVAGCAPRWSRRGVTHDVIDAIEDAPKQASGDATVARPPGLGREELDRIFSVEEFEPLAAERMGAAAYEYVRGWAGTGWTTRNNVLAFHRWVFRPRVLVDVTEIDAGTTVLGTPVSLPILFAPTAMHRLAHPDGEVATARAAKSLDTVQVLSSGASTSLEDVAAAGPKRWFQLDWLADRGVTQGLLDRSVAAGFGAIVLTVDSP